MICYILGRTTWPALSKPATTSTKGAIKTITTDSNWLDIGPWWTKKRHDVYDILHTYWIFLGVTIFWFYFVQVGLTRRQVAGLFLVLRRSQDLLQESDQNEKQRLHKDKNDFGDDPADVKIQIQMQILLERNLFHLFNIFHPKSASTLWQWVSYQKRDQICQMPEISHPNIDSF